MKILWFCVLYCATAESDFVLYYVVKTAVDFHTNEVKPWFSAKDSPCCDLVMAMQGANGGDLDRYTHPTYQVTAETQFGSSYLKNSRLCRQWTCVNQKLGFGENLPAEEQYASTLRSLLPQGSWQPSVNKVIDDCYRHRQRRYTVTCPGQSLLHCTFDALIQHCPEESSRKDDACAPLSSLAGFKYMFSQSRYKNLEKNLPQEHRPAWFLRNYFSSKCCDLPEIFNATLLEDCGFNSVISYHNHAPSTPTSTVVPLTTSTENVNVDRVRVVDLNAVNFETTPDPNSIETDKVNVVDISGPPDQNPDPLDCCDLSGFIEPSWRKECDFQLFWDKINRLTINNDTNSYTTTTERTTTTAVPVKSYDVKILPQSCEKETCVFSKLGIVSSGKVDLLAFSKLLDNMTDAHSSWTKTKARVVTKCLTKPITDYVEDCEINKVLACTFDVLSENCPHSNKHDPCKHTNAMRSNITCQVSSSKFRPKNRRQFCGIPSLVSHEVLMQCGIASLTRMEYVSEPITARPKINWWNKSTVSCKLSTDSTKCLLIKMDVLNKYGFLDYFKMKDRIRMFTSQRPEWASLVDFYLGAFTNMPLYSDQCSTSKKFLNVLDTLFATCPISKRKINLQCNRLFTELRDTSPSQKLTSNVQQKLDWGRLHPYSHFNLYPTHISQRRPGLMQNAHIRESTTTPATYKNPIFNGIFGLGDAPPVQIIDLKHTTYRPLVLLPVYMRTNGTGYYSAYRNGMMLNLNRNSQLADPNFMRI